MKQGRAMLPYLGVNGAAFYLMPLLIQDTGSGMAILLALIPSVCLIVSVVFGKNHGFCWCYPLAVVLLFLPAIFLFYNESAWVYVVGYGVTALLGNAIGTIRKREQQLIFFQKGEDDMNDGYELLTEKQVMWAEPLMQVLRENGIPCEALPVHGAGVTMKTGMPEQLRIYVPKEEKAKAEELLEQLFSA